MAKSGYTRPPPLTDAEDTACPAPSAVLYVANCGPAVGLTYDDIGAAFGAFGEIEGVHAADDSGARVIVRFCDPAAAGAAMAALHGRPCGRLAGRVLHVRYSVPAAPKARVVGVALPVARSSSELGIPGIYMVEEFVTAAEEQELLAAVDSRPWKRLAKRRVQHYGYEFLYETRNVDSKQFLGELPSFVSKILDKIVVFPGVKNCSSKVNQLTVNEYPCGVGLSPHIDTHSAFEEIIFSLSLAGPCIMEFRQYPKGSWRAPIIINGTDEASIQDPQCIRKAIFLPPRSMLLMSGEGRYAWHHYIPHHKIDDVGGQIIKRNLRRVSFTFRKVRMGLCDCEYGQFCDSQSKSDRSSWA